MGKYLSDAELIHSFADGKVLQYKSPRNEAWIDWTRDDCPEFVRLNGNEWHIKPAEPKKMFVDCFLY
jgi:hypothetical protein